MAKHMGSNMAIYPDCPEAIACIRGGAEAPGLSGKVRFYQDRRCVLVVADIARPPEKSGLDFFGFHIHEGGDCFGEDFPNIGGHYNPANAPHPNHAGDLPPLMLCNGGAYLVVRTDRFCVRDIIGRTVVIHSGSDDFRS